MNKEELKGLKYYLAYGFIAIAFFTYSGTVGWKWFNPTQTEDSRPATGAHRTGHYIRYHK